MIKTTTTGSAAYAVLGTFPQVPQRTGGQRLRLRGTVAGSALTALRVSSKLDEGGTSRVYLNDADLDVTSRFVPYTSKTDAGPSLFQTGVGGVFELELDVTGFEEVTIEAKAAGAGTVTLESGR